MASPSNLPPGLSFLDSDDGNSTAAANSTITNGTSPGLYHHPHHGGYGGGGSIDLVGVLVGILVPHAVCTLFVLARVGSRGILLRKWFLDDSLVVAAWLCSTAVCVVYSMSAIRSHNEQGSDRDDNSVLQDYLLRTYLGLIFYQLCLCLTKLSILALYLRMFAAVYASEAAASDSNRDSNSNEPSASTSTLRRHHLRERRLAWLTVAVVVAYGVPLLWMSIMQCYPSQSTADDSSGPLFFGHPVAVCFSFTPLLIASASLHTATDAWLIILVVPFVLVRLRFLPRSQRWALAAVLSLSIFVIAASLTRLQLSLRANFRPSFAGAQARTGPSRANTLGFFVMTILECDIALICATAPTLRPLLARLAPRLGLGDDGHGPFDRRSGVSHRRSLFHPRGPTGQRHDEDSEDLTSVVSYHGYPWTRNTSPAPGRRSRAQSRAQSRGLSSRGKMEKSEKSEKTEKTEVHTDKSALAESSGSHAVGLNTPKEAGTHPAETKTEGALPTPSLPVPIFSRPYKPHRTPTDHSLRSQPRSLPQSRDGTSGVHGDSSHGTPLSGGGGILTRRPSSVFFFENSDFYDQYFTSPATTPGGGGGPPPPTGGSGTKKAGVPGAGIGLGIVLHPHPRDCAASGSDSLRGLHRNSSQESFVMGLNDPASPTRLTRLTGVSGYSGETYTEEDSGTNSLNDLKNDLKKNKSGSDIDLDEYEMADLAQKMTVPKTVVNINRTEMSFLDDDTDTDGDRSTGQATPRASPSPLNPMSPKKPSPQQ